MVGAPMVIAIWASTGCIRTTTIRPPSTSPRIATARQTAGTLSPVSIGGNAFCNSLMGDPVLGSNSGRPDLFREPLRGTRPATSIHLLVRIDAPQPDLLDEAVVARSLDGAPAVGAAL